MHRSLAGSGIRARLLAGFALICVLPASVASDLTVRIKHVFGRRAAVTFLSAQLVGGLHESEQQVGPLERRGPRDFSYGEPERRAGHVETRNAQQAA